MLFGRYVGKKVDFRLGGGNEKDVYLQNNVELKYTSMKKWILMFLALVSCGVMQAQNAEVTLNNGKVVKGDIDKLSFNVDNYHEFRIKKTDGEKADLASTDVKEIKYYDKKAQKWESWVPMVAQMGLSMSYKENPKLYKNPVFLQSVYEGKNISAYIHYISTATHVKSSSIYGVGIMFYYKAKNDNFARSYYLKENGVTVGIGQKTMLKRYFKDYPQIKDILKDLSMKEFRKDPTILVKKLDEVLK